MKNTPTESRYSFFKPAGLLAVLVSATTAGSLQAADIYWNNSGSALYNVGGNWSPSTIPGSNDVVFVNNGGTVQVSDLAPAWTVSSIRLGSAAASNGFMDVSSGTVTSRGEMHIGGLGAGALTVSGGTLNVTGWLHLALSSGNASGTFNLSGGTVNAANHVTVGRRGTGVMNMTGGTLNMTGDSRDFVLGYRQLEDSGNSSGTLNHSGGTINAFRFVVGDYFQAASRTKSGQYTISDSAVLNTTEFLIGRSGGSGEVAMTGGEINIGSGSSSGFFAIAHNDGSNAVFNQSGGTVNKLKGETYLGRWAAGQGVTASWTLSGSAVANLDDVVVGQGSGTVATLTLNGGKISATQFRTGGGTSIINLNGGTIVSRTPSASHDFMSGLTAVRVQAGGVTFDTNGNDIVIAQNLVDDGGGSVTKIGLGSMTYRGNNTYLGDTIIEEGTFILADGGSMLFGIGADGDNNMLTGTGYAVLSGMLIFNFDYASATTLAGSWTIVDSLLNVTYGDTFSILGFDEIGAGLWSYAAGNVTYTFAESTGILTGVVPEPGYYALLVAFVLAGAVLVRRRMKR